MKLFLQVSALFVLLCISAGSVSSQIIWSEDFTYPDNTTAGPAGKWTSVCPACISGDYFEVRNNGFHASDVNDWAIWESQLIPTSTCGDISFSLSSVENGDHEGPGCGCNINIDYFDVYYSVSGGPYQVIANWNGDGEATHTLTGDSQLGIFTDLDWQSTSISFSGLTGTTLQLRVEMRNTAGSEIMILDDIIVNCTPLPVELTSLQAELVNENVEITWQTALESGSDHFLVERSRDGKAFFSIAKIAAAGNSDSPRDYQFIDVNPVNNRAFYRLRQVDQDGSYTITQVIEVVANGPALSLTSLYPNPIAIGSASDIINLKLFSSTDQSGSLEVFDTMGKQVLKQAISLMTDENHLKINTSGLSPGMYILRINAGTKVLNQRFLVK
jgi:hypothetical protein